MTFLLAVTIGSLVLALVMGAVAWRVAMAERERSDARVEALAADIHAAAPVAQVAGRRSEPPRLRAVGTPVKRDGDMFSDATPGTMSSARPAIAVGVGLLLFATAAALVVVIGGGATTGRSASPHGSASLQASVPLELVALGHERVDDRLTVRGVVRNPAQGLRLDGVSAVVFMFDKDGGFLGSGRAPIDDRSFAPGAESTFLVNVPGAALVARYRVSFRTEPGIVSHVDKRTRS
ncbi:MAG TPA: hypothetical protein VEU08_02195 [Vicinamibacterales bacterium]|nr:hypothetical protein [Vicinamibacterales bacterium]